MKTITLYNSLGQIMGTASCSDPDLLADDHGDLQAIDGAVSTDYYISNGQAILKPQDPSTDLQKYHFDYATKSWTYDATNSAEAARQARNQLLTAIDTVNPVWHASLNQQQQQELQAYRQALLDVPQQASFPTNTSWPAKPLWL